MRVVIRRPSLMAGPLYAADGPGRKGRDPLATGEAVDAGDQGTLTALVMETLDAYRLVSATRAARRSSRPPRPLLLGHA